MLASVEGVARWHRPGDDGTEFSLSDELTTSVEPVSRVRVGYRFGSRHLLTALYAPLTLTAKGILDRDLDFAGGRFPADSTLLAVYRFDSYRLTYRYSIIRRSDLEVGVGLTGKIRVAEIALYGPAAGVKNNTGFVPLVNLHVEWRPGDGRFGMLLDADALAAPQGRAEDVLLAATVSLRDGLNVYAGYRTLEGGADNDEVYTFAWLHYVVAGLRIQL